MSEVLEGGVLMLGQFLDGNFIERYLRVDLGDPVLFIAPKPRRFVMYQKGSNYTLNDQGLHVPVDLGLRIIGERRDWVNGNIRVSKRLFCCYSPIETRVLNRRWGFFAGDDAKRVMLDLDLNYHLVEMCLSGDYAQKAMDLKVSFGV